MAKYKESGTFLVGESETSAITMNERALTGIAITGNVISGSLVTFLVSLDGTNFYPLLDNNSTEIALVVSTTPKAYSLSPEYFLAWDFVKARLGTSSSAVKQATADEEVVFILDSM